MSIEENVQTVKAFFAAIGRGDKQGLLALSAEDIEWDHSGRGLGRDVPLLAELLRAVAKPFPQTPGIAKLTGTNSLLIR
jgi:ketosteroid isomerase-like protein